MFDMFDILVLPILANGSGVWGTNKSGLDVLDKVFLHYASCNLGVKATICNIIFWGEYGMYPWSILSSQCSVLQKYLHRLLKGKMCILYTLCIVKDSQHGLPRHMIWLELIILIWTKQIGMLTFKEKVTKIIQAI